MKFVKHLKELFAPESIQDLRMDEIALALNDHDIRTTWLTGLLNDLKLMNLQVDKALLDGSQIKLADLCARRRAYQDILDSILLSAQRVKTNDVQHNPRPKRGFADLDRVTG